MVATLIYHIAAQSDFRAAKSDGLYRCASLQSEKFIHCCSAQQFAGVVKRYYQNASDLVLLTIEVKRLRTAPVWENTVGGSELFPHLYSPLPMAAIACTEALDSQAIPDLVARENRASG
ncbi:MAG: DUF952 domain-containing protein [Gammaproteobacteria bacterium]|nr:DUF952 domain-containing protein [Gammaproteobacteria bacterium]